MRYQTNIDNIIDEPLNDFIEDDNDYYEMAIEQRRIDHEDAFIKRQEEGLKEREEDAERDNEI